MLRVDMALLVSSTDSVVNPFVPSVRELVCIGQDPHSEASATSQCESHDTSALQTTELLVKSSGPLKKMSVSPQNRLPQNGIARSPTKLLPPSN